MDDNKPRLIVDEYKCLPAGPIDEAWNLKIFKKQFRLIIVRIENNEMEFDLVGIPTSFVNAFRRIMISDIPSMAIDKVCILNNTSIIQDELLAHRIGLIPLKADPRLFDFKTDPNSENTEHDTLEFTLKIKCTTNKEANKDSSRAEDMYKNNIVYSEHLKWTPINDQMGRFKEKDVGPIDDKIIIAKLRPGHEIDLKLLAYKGIGRDHAKFSPVCTAWYRLLPEIKLLRDVEGEAAERLMSCFSPGVIEISHENGRKLAVVKDSRYDMISRNIYRYPDLVDSVVTTKIADHFIFTIESVGALKPQEIFIEAVKFLKTKCLTLLEELNSSNS